MVMKNIKLLVIAMFFFIILFPSMNYYIENKEPESLNKSLNNLNSKNDLIEICIRDSCIFVEIAYTIEEKRKGLMNRNKLDNDKGMLFIYEKEKNLSFWMKNTTIPLDMIWLSSEMKILHIEQAEPCNQDQCPSYTSSNPAKYLLETNKGFCKENNIKIGDIAQMKS